MQSAENTTGTTDVVEQPDMTDAEVYQSLGSTECPSCGNKKQPKMSFCRHCYYSLTPDVRQSLYEKDGYPDTFRAALAILGGE